MDTTTVEVPGELLDLLKGSRLGEKSPDEQVRTALAIHLFLEGIISIGKAAELAGENRVDFEWHLVQMGLPTVFYGENEAEQDRRWLSQIGARSDAP
jgi:predicted HTH domain antitoxin